MGDNIENDPGLKEAIDATEKLKRVATREYYSKLRNEREKATFAMMMRMNPDALTCIRKEFFAREDSVSVEEFIYIINKHLIHSKQEGFALDTPELREFGSNMYELFKDIDVNGDGDLEWQEFTSFTVEKANLLNKRQKLASIAHYHDTTDILDVSAQYRHRHDISKFVNMPPLGQFAILEDHKNAIYIFNSRYGKHLKTIVTETAPIAIECVSEKDKDFIVTSAADMTLSTYSLDDPNPNRRYQHLSSWATPGVQMTLTYQPESKLLYSGGTNGNIYSWRIHDRNLVSTLTGHSDIVMSLINLKKLNNVASASLDKTVCVWDSYTNERILNLQGHKKGVFDLTYSPDYRLLFSCGFEHDACVWSPFVNSLVFRLKGHHASLVGCAAVEGTPEIITGDTSGVFKLWDVRNFQCVQTFSANLSGNETKDSSKMTCFFHTKLPSANALQREDDSRIYAASKLLFSFDQARVVHEATTDKTNVFWIGWNEQASMFITASERNIIVWDALIGSKTVMNLNICSEEISACCLDDRKRKVVIGNIHGAIGVYNPTNGQLMKTVIDDNESTVIALEYVDETRRFIAGYANGIIKIYDENTLEDCYALRTFEAFNMHPELLAMVFNPWDRTVATTGASCGVARLWNYDAGKCEVELNVCGQSSEHVVTVAYLLPLPLIVTTDSIGNVSIWGSRGSRWPGIRIAGFLNQTIIEAEYEPFRRRAEDEEEPPRRIFGPKVDSVNSLAAEIDASIRNSAMKMDENNNSNDNDNISLSSNDRKGTNNKMNNSASAKSGNNNNNDDDDISTFSKDFSIGKRNNINNNNNNGNTNKSDNNNSSNSNNNSNNKDHQYSESIRTSMAKAQRDFEISEKKWGRVSPAQTVAWQHQEKLLYTCDDLGVLRCFDLRHLLWDINAETMLTNRPKSVPKGICKMLERDARSAMAPVHAEYFKYLVARPEDAMSYMGVTFSWAINAHDDRIIFCRTTSQGVLTSAADRMVKMWTCRGEPIGVLLQSVPPGNKSKSWDLDLDVKEIMQRENEELDDIVVRVDALARRDDNPNIETMDFTGMEPGAQSAEFSRSELRMRIEKTSSLLGLNFPTEGNQMNNDNMTTGNSTMDDLESISSDLDSAMSIGSKSLDSALIELKSPSAAVDYTAKTKLMTLLQRRRKATKLEMISNKYKEKTGVKIVTGEDGPQTTIGGGMTDDDVSDMDRYMVGSKKTQKTPSKDNDEASTANNSNNQGDGDTHSMASGSKSPANDKQHGNTNSRATHHHSHHHGAKSKILESINKFSAQGARTKTLKESCYKYSTFNSLESAMSSDTTNDNMSEKEREYLLQKRAERVRTFSSIAAMPMASSSKISSFSNAKIGILSENNDSSKLNSNVNSEVNAVTGTESANNSAKMSPGNHNNSTKSLDLEEAVSSKSNKSHTKGNTEESNATTD